MKENLKTIADRLGVSTSTVSRVLSGNATIYRISKDTASRVKSEAKRCGYTPNHIAQSLRKKKSNVVGLIIPTLNNLFFSKLASIILEEMHKKGYFSIVMASNEDESIFYNNLMELVSYNVDGIIAVPNGDDPSVIEQLRAKGHHIVLVDRYYQDSSIPFVSSNNYLGAFEATNYLIKKGHRKIICIQGNLNSTPNKERVRGYTEAMISAGLQDYVFVCGNEFSVQNGYLEMNMILLQDNKPTAVFSMANNINLGVIKAIREAGLAIGKDVSILSYDSFTHMSFSDPPVTRVAQPIEDMGALAVKLLLSEINGENRESTKLMLRHSLIEGKSVVSI